MQPRGLGTENYPMFTPGDQRQLRKLRFDRLCQQIPVLAQAILHMDSNENLLIHCVCPSSVDRLLAIKSHLEEQAWLILGSRRVSIWFLEEQIWTISTYDHGGKRR